MKKLSISTYRSFFLLLLISLVLTACGQNSIESPESVLDKAKEAVLSIDSGNVEVTAKAYGDDGTSDLSMDGDLGVLFNKKDEKNQKMDIKLALSGDMKSSEKAVNGTLDFNFINIGKQYYVKVNKLDSNDESLAGIKPVVDLYLAKWLRIAEDFIPQNIRDFQQQDEETKLKKKQLEDLFLKTKLFTVAKEYGIETLDGKKVYHYGLIANMDGFKDYMAKAAVIDGREMTNQEIEESVKILSYLKEAEVYIDAEDYYVLKATFHFSGASINQEANLEIEIDIKGSQFNESVNIEAPQGAEDFNPLSLMMDLNGIPATASDNTPADETKSSSGSPDVKDSAPPQPEGLPSQASNATEEVK